MRCNDTFLDSANRLSGENAFWFVLSDCNVNVCSFFFRIEDVNSCVSSDR